MDAGVEGEAFPLPGRALSSGQAVHFEDFRVEAVHPPVDAGREPAHAGPDDDDRFVHSFSLTLILMKHYIQPERFPPRRARDFGSCVGIPSAGIFGPLSLG
jgi:hypothetical protein